MPTMTMSKAFYVTVVLAVIVAAYLGLEAWLGVKEYWVGFLFLSQWGLMEQCRMDRLPASIFGAATGLLIALAPSQLPLFLGMTLGLTVTAVVTLAATYSLIMGWLPLFINAATMIFLTVITVPQIAQGSTPTSLLAGLATGVLFFGGLGLVGAAVSRAKGSAPVDVAPAE